MPWPSASATARPMLLCCVQMKKSEHGQECTRGWPPGHSGNLDSAFNLLSDRRTSVCQMGARQPESWDLADPREKQQEWQTPHCLSFGLRDLALQADSAGYWQIALVLPLLPVRQSARLLRTRLLSWSPPVAARASRQWGALSLRIRRFGSASICSRVNGSDCHS
ncbi:hypothetical protein D9M68_286380 [compost metagenome]